MRGRQSWRPIVGLVIFRGLRQDGDEYVGGHILDPENSSTYRCKAQLLDGGTKLRVRGYIGILTLGRTQVWLREEGASRCAPLTPIRGADRPRHRQVHVVRLESRGRQATASAGLQGGAGRVCQTYLPGADRAIELRLHR